MFYSFVLLVYVFPVFNDGNGSRICFGGCDKFENKLVPTSVPGVGLLNMFETGALFLLWEGLSKGCDKNCLTYSGFLAESIVLNYFFLFYSGFPVSTGLRLFVNKDPLWYYYFLRILGGSYGTPVLTKGTLTGVLGNKLGMGGALGVSTGLLLSNIFVVPPIGPKIEGFWLASLLKFTVFYSLF